MDAGEHEEGDHRDSPLSDHEDDYEEADNKPRDLPADLPRTLDDRRNFTSYNQETEYYDAWQGGLILSGQLGGYVC